LQGLSCSNECCVAAWQACWQGQDHTPLTKQPRCCCKHSRGAHRCLLILLVLLQVLLLVLVLVLLLVRLWWQRCCCLCRGCTELMVGCVVTFRRPQRPTHPMWGVGLMWGIAGLDGWQQATHSWVRQPAFWTSWPKSLKLLLLLLLLLHMCLAHRSLVQTSR